jgi:hypothetical protein
MPASTLPLLYTASALQSVVFPYIVNNQSYYIDFTQGFGNGMAFISPGYYDTSLFAPNFPNTTDPSCSIPVQDQLVGYDVRCRSWFTN